jgi:hypothetical protein
MIVVLFSCKNDEQINYDHLSGTWEMVNAKRNNKETSTLDKSFFSFTDSKISHNINGDTIVSSFTTDGNKIIVNDEMINELKINSLSSDSLSLGTKISNMKFEFLMKKSNE